MIAVGLFCSLKDATVENLVIDSTCSFTGISAGALSASADGSLIVRNTTNKATVTGNQKLGGFIGYVEGLEQPTVISFEDCVNEANVTATRSYVGGFVGSVSSNANITFTVSNSANNGNVNGNEQYVGGFVGFIFNNTIVHMNIFNFTNSGTVSGSRGSVGGFIGSFYKNTFTETTISNTINNGFATGQSNNIGGFVGSVIENNNTAITTSNSINNGNVTNSGSCVGGFVGFISSNTNITMTISNSINNDIAILSGSGAGGFTGSIFSNVNMTMIVSNSTNNGSINGNDMVGGFSGNIESAPETRIISLEIKNSANKGNVTAKTGTTCGLFCVKSNNNVNVKTRVKNSINEGSVKADKSAYGITNIITVARNVVSMGDVTSPCSFTFWDASTDVNLFYGFDGKFINCCDGATLFQYNSTTGFYEVVETGEHVDDLLNDESVNQHFGMV